MNKAVTQNKEQLCAKHLASMICAFAAGSAIQTRHVQLSDNKWSPMQRGVRQMLELLENGWELRIAPKPPKQKFARIALCNLAKVDANNIHTFPMGIQQIACQKEPGWIPAEVIIRKGRCKEFEQHPTFVKWLSDEFPLTTQPRA